MKKAYINGVEVTILQFYQDRNNIASCKVRVNSSGWVIDTPISLIEIR